MTGISQEGKWILLSGDTVDVEQRGEVGRLMGRL